MSAVIAILLSGYAGYYVFLKLKLPSPQILGPLTLTAIANLAGWMDMALPDWAPMFFTIGVAISVTQNFDLKFKGIFRSLLIVILYSLGVGMAAFSWLSFSGMSPQTAYFSAMPGGGADLALISMGFPGADPFRVVIYQTIRFFAVVVLYPILLHWLIAQKQKGGLIGRRMKGPVSLADKESMDALALYGGPLRPAPLYKPLTAPANDSLVCGILGIGFLFALGFKAIHFAGGNYLGGMAATILVLSIMKKKFGVKPTMDRHTSTFFKVASCSIIGMQVTWDSIRAFASEWPALIIMNLIIILSCLLLGWVFYRLGWGDFVTCMLETAPSGVLPMTVLAEEMKGDVVRIALFQLVRILAIVMAAPLLGPYLLF